MQEAERHNRRLFCKKRCPAAAGMDKERQERVHMREAIYNNFIKDERWRYLTDGLQVTLEVTFFSVLIGIVIGFLVAVVRSTYDKTGKLKLLNAICRYI